MFAPLTRSAGTAALAAAAGWLVLLAAFLVQAADNLFPWQVIYTLTAAGGLIVGVATIIALNGMLARAGGGGAAWRKPAIVLAVVGVGFLVVVNWATPMWSAVLSAASLVTVFRLRAAGLFCKVGSWAFAAAWPLSFGLFVLLDAMKTGRVDEYGDYPVAGGIGIAVWCGLFALGLAAHGRWLRSQEESGEQSAPALA